jgi:hypothetical protein
VGTSGLYGVESSPCKVNSESTISTDKAESVFDKSKLEGVVDVGVATNNGNVGAPSNQHDPINSLDIAWTPSKLKVGGGESSGFNSTNIWLDNREGGEWLGRIDKEKLILQSLHNIYGGSEGRSNGDQLTIDCDDDAHTSRQALHILEAAAINSGYELKLVRRKRGGHEESRICVGVDDTIRIALFWDERMVKISRRNVPDKRKVSSYKTILATSSSPSPRPSE